MRMSATAALPHQMPQPLTDEDLRRCAVGAAEAQRELPTGGEFGSSSRPLSNS